MRSVTPLRIALVLTMAVLLCVGVISAYPDGRIPLTSHHQLRFFTLTTLTWPGTSARIDISDIIAQHEDTEEADTLVIVPPPEVDTIARKDTLIVPPAEAIMVPHKIELPPGNDTVLLPFFATLDRIRTTYSTLRILHYGDSQIEGDRITSELRHRLQTNPNFSGCGTGLLPIRDILQGRLAVSQSQSANWLRWSTWQMDTDTLGHHHYGLMGNYYRYLPHDSILPDTVPPDLAWWQVERTNMGRAGTRQYEQLRILYRNNPEALPMRIVRNGSDTMEALLPAKNGFGEWEVENEEGFQSLRLEWEGHHSPDIFGVALDCHYGLAVDNIGMRGMGVSYFAQMSRGTLAAQLEALDVGLIILQFGVNVVPNELEHYGWYERMLVRHIEALKEAAPHIPVLVIGVNDMSKKDGLEYVSYPNIEKIRDAQRRAAFRTGCAFWDLHSAMGGANSMASWVHNDPPLAAGDHTHLTNRGARIVGKMIYEAIMEAYYGYKKVHP